MRRAFDKINFTNMRIYQFSALIVFLWGCSTDSRFRNSSPIYETSITNMKISGACLIDPKYEYSFQIDSGIVKCTRWPVAYPEKSVVREGDAKMISETCMRIRSTIPESSPPFLPASIQVSLKFVGEDEKYYIQHPPHELQMVLLKQLRVLY